LVVTNFSGTNTLKPVCHKGVWIGAKTRRAFALIELLVVIAIVAAKKPKVQYGA
jgi:prepilin-type N-terminal cleavage/methylation domain-containing protein